MQDARSEGEKMNKTMEKDETEGEEEKGLVGNKAQEQEEVTEREKWREKT